MNCSSCVCPSLTAVHIRPLSIISVLSWKECLQTFITPDTLPWTHMHTHVCHCHTAWCYNSSGSDQNHSFRLINQVSVNNNQKRKLNTSQNVLAKANEVVLINSHKDSLTHPESIIHSLNTECLISSTHWGPGMNKNKQACVQVHGETVRGCSQGVSTSMDAPFHFPVNTEKTHTPAVHTPTLCIQSLIFLPFTI